MADGKVVIDTGLDISGAQSDIKSLSSLLNKIKIAISNTFSRKSVDSYTASIDTSARHIRSLESQLEKTRAKMEELGSKQIATEEFQQIQQQIESTQAKLDKLVAKKNEWAESGKVMQGQAWEQLNSQIDQCRQTITYAKSEQEQMVSEGTAYISGTQTEAYDTLLQKVHELEAELQKLRSAQNEGASGARKTSVSLTSLANGFKAAFNAARKFISTKFGKATNDMSGGIKKLTKNLLRYTLGIRSTFVLINKLRRAAMDGLNNLVKGVPEVNKNISQLTSRFATFKNAMGSALYTAIAPMIPLLNKVVDALTNGANAAAKFIAALTGQKQIYKANEVQQDYAESLDKTASSAKKATKALGAYDELNVISSADDGGASGGGGFTAEAVDASSGLAERIKESWQAADFSELGQILATKLNNALSSIDWNYIQGSVNKGILSLTSFLNGAISGLDWTLLGTTIATGFNTALNGIYLAVTTFDWVGAASGLASAINGLFTNIDYSKLAQTVSAAIVGTLQYITTFISTIDWSQIPRIIVDLISNVSWLDILAGLGQLIWSAVVAAFNIGQGIYNYIIVPLFEKLGQLGENLGEWFYDMTHGGAAQFWAGLWAGIKDFAGNVWGFVRDTFVNPIINSIKDLFGIHSPSKVFAEFGTYMMQGLFNGVKSMISTVINLFKSLWTKIKSVFGTVGSWFKSTFQKAWEGVRNVFSKGGTIFKGITTGILDFFKKIVNTLIDGINDVVAIPFKGINSALKSIKDVSILGAKPFDFLPTISVPKIPHLATGDVIPANKPFYALLGDQKHGTNVEAPLSTIKQAVKEELDERGGSGASTVIVQISGKEAARVVWDEFEKRYKQIGKYRYV